MQKIQIIIGEVLLCNILNVWFQKYFIRASFFKKRKKHKFSNFSYPGLRKALTSAKIITAGRKCCRHLMQDSLKYLCAQFGYD